MRDRRRRSLARGGLYSHLNSPPCIRHVRFPTHAGISIDSRNFMGAADKANDRSDRLDVRNYPPFAVVDRRGGGNQSNLTGPGHIRADAVWPTWSSGLHVQNPIEVFRCRTAPAPAGSLQPNEQGGPLSL